MSGYVLTISQVENEEMSQWAVAMEEVESPTIGLERLQDAVHGLVEPLSMTWDGMGRIEPFDLDLWVNEEGLLLGMEPNIAASTFASFVMGYPMALVGDCIITGMDYESGDTVPLTQEQAWHVRSMVAALAQVSGAVVE